jgi:hypothetical protein
MSNITTAQQGFAPTTLTEAMTFSEMLAKSQMVPKAYQGKPEDVLVAMQWGRELGLAPLQALQNIACINGKPSVYGDAAMALVQASHVCEDIEEFFEGEDTPNPVAVCIAQRRGRKACEGHLQPGGCQACRSLGQARTMAGLPQADDADACPRLCTAGRLP